MVPEVMGLGTSHIYSNFARYEILKVALLKDSSHLECDMSSRMQAQKVTECTEVSSGSRYSDSQDELF